MARSRLPYQRRGRLLAADQGAGHGHGGRGCAVRRQPRVGQQLLPLAEGAITADHLRAELGEVLTGQAAGRTGAAEITVFKSLGLAVEDLAAAVHVTRLAAERGAGLPVPF
jgi:ornithine cyclodeaminase/alanine dehydrogenase-like protein (mu-crystallin family)